MGLDNGRVAEGLGEEIIDEWRVYHKHCMEQGISQDY